jgi:predicted DNA-binding WGR domain protein
MTALHLRRIDPARNMRRFYRLDVQPDLFERGLLVRLARFFRTRRCPFTFKLSKRL